MNYLRTLLFLSIILQTAGCSKKNDGTTTPVVVTPPFVDTAFSNVPAVANMAIYELNIPAFSASGTIAGAADRLDSLKNLGINVIWLMPIYPIGYTNAIGSPYSVNNYTAVNSSFGTLDDLRQFVISAHKKNMAVILDWVADHTSWDNSWIKNKSWYMQDANGNIISPPGTGWTDVAQLNYTNITMRAAMISAMKYWITQSNVDGFRCDAASMVPSSFWQQAIDSLNSISPDRKIILLAESNQASDFTEGFQLDYAFDFISSLKSIFQNGTTTSTLFSTDAAEYNIVPSGCQKMRYITNHDENYSNSLITDYKTASGTVAAFVATAFLRGVPLIYDGQEVAYPNSISYFENGTIQPIDWTLNPAIYNEYKKIMSIHNSLNCINNGTTTQYTNNSEIIAYKHTYQNQDVLVIVNPHNSPVTYTLPSDLANTTWTNLMNNASMSLTTSLTMPAYSFYILQ